MAFVLPSRFNMDSAPRPTDPSVSLVENQSRKVAVIRFRGRAGQNQVKAKTKELLSVLKSSNKKNLGEPFLMRYNPPFIPGFLRHNEIGVEIE
jgi:hypothetical protein